MTAATSLLRSVDKLLMQAIALIACIALVVAVGAGFWQVLSRFLFAAPSIWSEALTRLMLIWMVLLGLSLAIRRGSMISIELMSTVATGRLKILLAASSLLSFLVLFAVLAWFGIELVQRIKFQEMAGLGISMAWGYAAIPVGSIVGAIGAIAHFADHFEEARV